MINKLRQAFHEVAGFVGLEVHKKIGDPLRFLSLLDIRTVLDVGANQGQFARRARRLFPEATVYSFEPIPHVFNKLAQIAERDRRFEAFNLCLGDEVGEADFEENNFSGSSSMLPLSQRAVEAFPYTSETKRIRVSVTTLDEWARDRTLETPMLVKMDVQGFEGRVISGGERIMTSADAVVSEVSFINLYDGQPLFHEIQSKMLGHGFFLAGMIENTCDPATGEILQADAIFVTSRVHERLGLLRAAQVGEE